MLKKTLINNVIALAVYGLSAAGVYVYRDIIDYNIPENVHYLLVVPYIAVLLYVLCGFFLKPVEKRSFLSVISVPIAIIIILIICMQLGDAGFEYYFLNPILPWFFQFDSLVDRFVILFSLIFLLSPMYPSLLMYLGMVIRKRVIRHKTAKSHKSDA